MTHFRLAAASLLLIVSTAQAAVEDAVYVSSSAAGSGNTGLTPQAPVASITQALAIAAANGRHQVHVAGGTYGAFTMVNGIDIIGGFDQQFQLPVVPTPATTAIVQAATMGLYALDAAIVAQGITQPTRLSGLMLQQRTALPGRNSVGLLIVSSSSGLTVENLQIIGAASIGAAASGFAGSSAPQAAAPAGSAGLFAMTREGCSDSFRAGGAGAIHNAGGVTANGGQGGAGGRQSTSCGIFPNGTATAGQAGTAASNGGAGGSGAPANSTAAGAHGGNGTTHDGTSGNGGRGGHSGAGAGGPGGHSIGILRSAASAPVLTAITYSGGAGGAGGTGGAAAVQPGAAGLPSGVHGVLAASN